MVGISYAFLQKMLLDYRAQIAAKMFQKTELVAMDGNFLVLVFDFKAVIWGGFMKVTT